MRLDSYMTFVDMLKETKDAFKLIGREDKFNESDTLQAIELDTGSEEYKIFLNELGKKKIKYDERFQKKFSESELKEAEYLKLFIGNYWGYPQPEDRYRKLCFDVSSACPKCGNGAKQIKPFMLREPLPKNKKIEIRLLNWVFEYIITDRIAGLIKDRGFTGCEIWPLINFKTKKEILGWKQLYFSHEVPPMSPKTNIPLVPRGDPTIEEQFGIRNPTLCECGKLGRNIPDVIYYDEKDINKFCDFNKSHEWLAGGYTTYQIEIISNRVYQFFLEQKIKNMSLIEPVLIDR